MVLPVYNEADCIAAVLRAWIATFEGLGIDFGAIVLNDGSRDATWQQLQAFADDPRLELVDKPNGGHGPTILRGYREAVGAAEWAFQCDSDDEMPPDSFGELWQRREGHDAVFGYRSGRAQDFLRRVVTWASRGTVRRVRGVPRAGADAVVPRRVGPDPERGLGGAPERGAALGTVAPAAARGDGGAGCPLRGRLTVRCRSGRRRRGRLDFAVSARGDPPSGARPRPYRTTTSFRTAVAVAVTTRAQ